MTSWQKSYGEYNEIKKPALVTSSYEWSDSEEELEMVPVVNQNNNSYNLVSDSNSGSNNKEAKENLFTIILMRKSKQPQWPLSMLKWYVLWKIVSLI